MIGSLQENGWELSKEAVGSDAVIINTCGFINEAKQESIDTILEAGEIKKTHPDMKLVVAGCLSQRYKSQLERGLPEVDIFIGTDQFIKIADYLKEHQKTTISDTKRSSYIYNEHLPRTNTLSKQSAYVKIAEGCQHQCAFCIIPAIRGPLRSRPIKSVVKEVVKLASDGVVEINLIAQDLAAYGREKGADELLPLLRELVKIDDIKIIRLLYMYPENITDEFIQFMKSEPKLAKYLDIPIQHASDKILYAMKRGVNRQFLESVLLKLRLNIPDIAIRTSVMVGFPGETDQDFSELLDFVEKMKFDHLGCFSYSKEEGTVAGRMSAQVDEEIKSERQKAIMLKQKEISKETLEKYVGRTLDVLVEGLSSETDLLLQGRTQWQAPDVDGLVYINDGDAVVGKIQKVMIEKSHDYDLVGRIV